MSLYDDAPAAGGSAAASPAAAGPDGELVVPDYYDEKRDSGPKDGATGAAGGGDVAAPDTVAVLGVRVHPNVFKAGVGLLGVGLILLLIEASADRGIINVEEGGLQLGPGGGVAPGAGPTADYNPGGLRATSAALVSIVIDNFGTSYCNGQLLGVQHAWNIADTFHCTSVDNNYVIAM